MNKKYEIEPSIRQALTEEQIKQLSDLHDSSRRGQNIMLESIKKALSKVQSSSKEDKNGNGVA